MQTIRPSVLEGKRQLDGPSSNPVSVDLGNALASKIMRTTFSGDRTAVAPVVQSLPGGMGASMSVVNTGFSTMDQQTGEIMTQPIVIRPWFQDGWEKTFIPGTSLFVNNAEPWTGNAKGMHAAASVPILNYFSERGARAKAGGKGAGPFSGPRSRANVDDYSAFDEQDFARKWSHVGVMTTDMKSDASWRARERMIGVSTFGRQGKVFNLFGENVRPGDRLYYVTKRYPAASSAFIAPDGTTQAQYTSFPKAFLQTRGATDKGAGFVPHCTDHPGSVGGGGGASGDDPSDADRDSWEADCRLAQEYREYEWDEEGGTFMAVVRNIAEEEGRQEAVASAPELVYRAYQEGHVTYVGVAKTLMGHPPSQKTLAEAHRNIHRMVKLQTIELWAGV